MTTLPTSPTPPASSQPETTLAQSIIKILISAGTAGVAYVAGKNYLPAAVAATIAAAIPNFAEAIVDTAVKYLNK
jgi:hypothetical protein